MEHPGVAALLVEVGAITEGVEGEVRLDKSGTRVPKRTPLLTTISLVSHLTALKPVVKKAVQVLQLLVTKPGSEEMLERLETLETSGVKLTPLLTQLILLEPLSQRYLKSRLGLLRYLVHRLEELAVY